MRSAGKLCLSLSLAIAIGACEEELGERLPAGRPTSSAAEAAVAGWTPEEAVPASTERAYMRLRTLLEVGDADPVDPTILPDWYGGCYGESDTLVVLLTSDKSNQRDEFCRQLSQEAVTFRPCRHSYRAISAAAATVLKSCEGASDELLKVTLIAPDVVNNRVMVGVSEKTPAVEATLQRLRKSLKATREVEFGVRPFVLRDDDGILCGDSLGQLTHSGFSAGYRAIDADGQKGIVTAGHCMHAVGVQLYSQRAHRAVGVCTQCADNDGHLDAAFCAVYDQDFMPTNRIFGATLPAIDTLSTVISYPYTNAPVHKVGRTTGRTFGHLTSLDATAKRNGQILVEHALVADYDEAGGDSGGIVYMLYSSTNTRRTLGINKGHDSIPGSDLTMIIRADIINATFGLTRY